MKNENQSNDTAAICSASDTPRVDGALAYLKRLNERWPDGSGDLAGYSVLGVQNLINTAKELERENARLRETIHAAMEGGGV